MLSKALKLLAERKLTEVLVTDNHDNRICYETPKRKDLKTCVIEFKQLIGETAKISLLFCNRFPDKKEARKFIRQQVVKARRFAITPLGSHLVEIDTWNFYDAETGEYIAGVTKEDRVYDKVNRCKK